MPYTTEAQIAALIPAEHLAAALDDDNDGEADAGLLDTIIEAVGTEIDAHLGQRFTVPFDDADLPAVVSHAARVLVAEALYARRGFDGDKNPWGARAKLIRAKIERIGTGKEPLRPATEQAPESVTAITGPSQTYLADGSLPT